MAALAPRRVPNVVFGLCLFWGGVLSAFFWMQGFKFSFLLPWTGALFAGAWAARSHSLEYHQKILDRLRYRRDANLPVSDMAAFLNSNNGLTSSLGPAPIHVAPLPRAESYSFADLQLHAPGELTNQMTSLFGRFLSESARDRYPAHTVLFDALALVHLHPANVNTPAGIDRHGGRSVLMHSLLLFGLMSHRVDGYVYMLTHSKRKLDDDFKIDPSDPLIPLLALAHDIGKIRSMVLDASGKAVHLKPGHDAQSSRDLAQMPEFWDLGIPQEDRYILQMALALSGKAADAPIQRQTKAKEATVTSDRLYALMGLLAECDRLATWIEMGGSYHFNELPKPVASDIKTEEVVEPINLMSLLSSYFVMSMPVNARSPNRSVGFKRHDQQLSRGRHVVIIDELEFVPSFSAFIEKPELNVRDGKSSPLTKSVLSALDEHGFLFRFDEGPNTKPRPATSCLYKIEFRPEGASQDSDPTFVLSSAFIVDLTDWPNMAKLQSYPNCLSTPTFAGFRLGRQPAKNTRRSVEDAIATEVLTGATETVGMDVSALTSTKKPNKEKPGKVINKIKLALFNKKITVAASDDAAMAVVGCDDFFISLGIDIKHHEELPDSIKQLGITQINKSVKNPNVHVVRLARAVYGDIVAEDVSE